LEAGPGRAVILAARGTDQQQTLTQAVPPDLATQSIEASLGQLFGQLALLNPQMQILLRIRGGVTVTAWIVAHESQTSRNT
jgi:hypothetical protein